MLFKFFNLKNIHRGLKTKIWKLNFEKAQQFFPAATMLLTVDLLRVLIKKMAFAYSIQIFKVKVNKSF